MQIIIGPINVLSRIAIVLSSVVGISMKFISYLTSIATPEKGPIDLEILLKPINLIFYFVFLQFH